MDTIATTTSVAIQFSSTSPTTYCEIHRVVPTGAVAVQLAAKQAVSVVQRSPFVVPQPAAMTLQPHDCFVDIFMRRQYTVDRRSHRSAWQGRLGAKMDTLRTKVLDNSLLLTAHPTDMLRIRTERDPRSQDVVSRTVVAAEVLPIVLPILKDVPMRRIIKENQQAVVTFSMAEDAKPFEIYSALSNQLYRDDLLFRIIKDPYSDSPYLLAMQIKDEVATLAYSSLLYVKYKATIFDEKLPQAIVDQLVAFATKRELLKW